VWGSAGGDANALRSHISHLRRKLEVGVGGDVPGTISSVPAVGYIFRRSGPKPTAAAPATAVPKAVSATPPAAASLSTAAAS